MSTALLQLQGVAKSFGALRILDDIELEAEAGSSLAIVGPSGCGKSTLLNLIGGLMPADRGTIQLGETRVDQLDEDSLARYRNREVGFVFQSHHLLPQCSALENVLLPGLAEDNPSEHGALVQRAEDLLGRVGLAARMHHRPAALSGGESQRVAVVRALIHQPRLLLADEPTGSLDPVAAESLGQLLGELNASEGTTLLTVTHSAELAGRMQRQLELREGRLVELSRQP